MKVFVSAFCARCIVGGTLQKDNDNDEPPNGPLTNFLGTKFVAFLKHKVTKLIIFVIFVGFACLSAYYSQFYLTGIEMQSLLPDNSYAIDHLNLMEKYFLSSGVRMQVVVNDAPDLSRSDQRQKMDNLMDSYVNSNVTTGLDSVEFWFHDYERSWFYADNLTSQQFYLKINDFLKNESFHYYSDDVTWGEISLAQRPSMIVAFRFFIGLKKFSNIADQMLTVNAVRAIAAKYSDHDVTTFALQWLTVDQMITAPWNALMTICGQFAGFVVLTFLLVPHPAVALCVILSVLFVQLDVIASSILLGTTLNSFSFVALVSFTVLSTHFSVHIGYAFCSVRSSSASERLKNCAVRVFWPTFEVIASTLISLCFLWTFDFYVLLTVLQCLTLAIVISLIHSILFLPVLLTTVVGKRFCFGDYRREISGIRAIDDVHAVVADQGRRPKDDGNFERYSLPLYPVVKLPRVSTSTM